MAPPLSADTLAHLLADRAASSSLSGAEVDYIVDRLSTRGVFQDIHNWGGIRCLCAHVHGDGAVCAISGPLFDRRFIRVYKSDKDGIEDLIRVARHATLSGAVEDVTFNLDMTPNVNGQNVGGYRSVETMASDVVGDSDEDRLDLGSASPRLVGLPGIFARFSLGRSDGDVSGVEDVLFWPQMVLLRKLLGPGSDAQSRIEEVAAQWSTLKKKMDANPKIEAVLRDSYDHWIKFYGQYQRRGDLSLPELKALSEDVRVVISEVNLSRANAESIEKQTTVFVQDLANPIKDIASESVSVDREAAQFLDDKAKEAEADLSSLISDNKWKIVIAAVLAAAAAVGVAKIASPVKL